MLDRLCNLLSVAPTRGARRLARARVVVGVFAASGVGASLCAATLSGGCSSSAETGIDEDAGDAGADAVAEMVRVVSHPDAQPLPGQTTCEVVQTTGIPVASANHVPVCTPVKYATNPPSGGDHWPIWAIYQEYTSPVPRPMYVHDMEHGGVVLAYRCPTGCPDVVAALEKAAQSAPADCQELTNPEHARIVITPDGELATPIGIGAWGATYTATCIDPASLASFVHAVYDHGREELCADGMTPVDCSVADGGSDGG